MSSSQAEFRTGLIFGLIAYLSWGLVPLFFAQLRDVAAGELLAHRILWSLCIMMVVTAIRTGGFSELWRALANRQLIIALTISAFFLAINWLLYIYATLTDRVTDASLGYYAMPLANAFFARIFLGEQLRPAHYPALLLIAVGLVVASVMLGTFPWLAVALPITFGFYALMRKKTHVDSMTGLMVETLVLLLPSISFLIYLAVMGQSSFGPDPRKNFWLIFSGVMTVVPLLSFALSIRRLPFLTQSFIQFLSPTVQMTLAIFVLGEEPIAAKLVAMFCVWVAVGIFIADAVYAARERRRVLSNMEELEAVV